MTYNKNVDELAYLLKEFFRTKTNVFDATLKEMISRLRSGKKILVFGNGGSAAQAQHFAAELVGRFQKNRMAIAALSLATDTSVLTSVANDWSFETVFSRQIEALGCKDDVALALTTSGNSPNVIAALTTSRKQDLFTIALTGPGGGKLASLPSILLDIPSTSTPRIQEAHLFLLHLMAEQMESRLSSGSI